MCEWAEILAVVESLATVTALAVGGWWTWTLYVRQRLGFPKLNLTLHPDPVHLDSGWLIHVGLVVQNTGSVIARLRSAELRLRQVKPLPEEVASKAHVGLDPIPKGRQEIEWPLLVKRPWSWEDGACEVEPGESDYFGADFFVPKDVEVVQFYTFFGNAQKKSGIGWALTMNYKLPDWGKSEMVEEKRTNNSEQQKQQRQQPQQRQQQQQPQQQQQHQQTTEKKK